MAYVAGVEKVGGKAAAELARQSLIPDEIEELQNIYRTAVSNAVARLKSQGYGLCGRLASELFSQDSFIDRKIHESEDYTSERVAVQQKFVERNFGETPERLDDWLDHFYMYVRAGLKRARNERNKERYSRWRSDLADLSDEFHSSREELLRVTDVYSSEDDFNGGKVVTRTPATQESQPAIILSQPSHVSAVSSKLSLAAAFCAAFALGGLTVVLVLLFSGGDAEAERDLVTSGGVQNTPAAEKDVEANGFNDQKLKTDEGQNQDADKHDRPEPNKSEPNTQEEPDKKEAEKQEAEKQEAEKQEAEKRAAEEELRELQRALPDATTYYTLAEITGSVGGSAPIEPDPMFRHLPDRYIRLEKNGLRQYCGQGNNEQRFVRKRGRLFLVWPKALGEPPDQIVFGTNKSGFSYNGYPGPGINFPWQGEMQTVEIE